MIQWCVNWNVEKWGGTQSTGVCLKSKDFNFLYKFTFLHNTMYIVIVSEYYYKIWHFLFWAQIYIDKYIE